MWSINRWTSHAELLKISTMNFLYSSIKRNNKTYLNGKKDWFEPFFQPHGFWRSAIPSRQLCLLSGPHRSGCFTPKQELLPQPPPPPTQVPAALSRSWGLALQTHCLSWNVHCGWDGKGFSDSWFKMTWWNTHRGRMRWTGCSQALRTEVPQMNFFFFESIVYFSKYDVNQRTGGSVNHKI